MSQTKEADRQKRRTKVVPVLGTVGLSLSLASGASVAAIGSVNQETDPVTSAPPVAQQVMDEEEISEVSLAIFPSGSKSAWAAR
jgi:hypothetical protein